MHSSDCTPVAGVMEGSDYGEQMVCSGDIFVRCVAEKENTAETSLKFEVVFFIFTGIETCG